MHASDDAVPRRSLRRDTPTNSSCQRALSPRRLNALLGSEISTIPIRPANSPHPLRPCVPPSRQWPSPCCTRAITVPESNESLRLSNEVVMLRFSCIWLRRQLVGRSNRSTPAGAPSDSRPTKVFLRAISIKILASPEVFTMLESTLSSFSVQATTGLLTPLQGSLAHHSEWTLPSCQITCGDGWLQSIVCASRDIRLA